MVKFCDSNGILRSIGSLFILHGGIARAVKTASLGSSIFFDGGHFNPMYRDGDDSTGMSVDEEFCMPCDGLFKMVAIGSGGSSAIYGEQGYDVVIGQTRSAGGGSGGCGISEVPVRKGDYVHVAIVGASASYNHGNASIRLNGNGTANLVAFGFGGGNGNPQGNAGGAGGGTQYSDPSMSFNGKNGSFYIASDPSYDEVEAHGGDAANPSYRYGIGESGYFKGYWHRYIPTYPGGSRFGRIEITRIGEFPFTSGGKWNVSLKWLNTGDTESYQMQYYGSSGTKYSWGVETSYGDVTMMYDKVRNKWYFEEPDGGVEVCYLNGRGNEKSLSFPDDSYSPFKVVSASWSE